MQRKLVATAFLLSLLGGFASNNAIGQGAASRLTQPINEANRVTLKGHVLPSLTPDKDMGMVEDSMSLQLSLALQRTPAQQADLDSLLAAQQNSSSAQYHKWLTPEQFGARFGASEADIQTIREWLVSQGFEVASQAKNASVISFKATSAGVRASFQAQLHYWNIAGGKHVATANEPTIPAGFAGLVSGLAGLNQVPYHTHHTPISQERYDADTHKWYTVQSSQTESGVQPHYSDGNGGFNITPQDYYTIYNVNPTFTAGNHGEGSTIAIIGSGNFNFGTVSGGTAGGTATGGDVTTFRNLFGITTPLNLQIEHGSTNFPCTDPTGTESGESALDVEWAGALAPAAKIVFEDCSGDSAFLTEVQALVDKNEADIISSSLGISEQLQDAGARASFDTAFVQAALQGQTILSAQGDSGSDDTDFGSAQGVSGLSIDYPSANPLVLSIGGTDFQDRYDVANGSNIPQSTYWSATNSKFYGDALGYVPETVWDDSCASPLVANIPDIFGSPGQATATNCNDNPNGKMTGGAGGGGISIDYAQPSWQTGIPGLSASITKRATPDVSMFASGGTWWGHHTVLCDSSTASTACTSPSTFGGAGGTSFAAPEFAGILGLLRTGTGSRQGLVQPALYALAKAQYTAGTACYANGQTANRGNTTSLPASACIFHDVTTGSNNNECEAGTPNCFTDPGASFGVFTSAANTSTFIDAYAAGPRYDLATGLGSVDVTNLITKWNTAFTSTTSLTAAPTTITAAQSTLLTATVKGGLPPGADDGTPPALSGSVNFTAGSVKVGSCTLSKGSCSASVLGSALQSGANSVTATFVGSKSYPSSTSSIVVVTVQSSGGGGGTTATPTFSPFGGTFTGPVSVKISDTTAGASIYYTTNGQNPSAHSTLYTGPITVSVTETVKAIAIAPGGASNTVTANFTIKTGGGGGNQCTVIDYSKGFSGTGMTLNGGAVLNSNTLQLTDNKLSESRSAFYTTPVPMSSFITDFTFQILNPNADGFTFTVQQIGAHALGAGGGGLGYSGIKQSAAMKFDLYNNNGEGINSTGMYMNGAFPATPSTNLTPSGINLHSGHVFAVHIDYTGTKIFFTLTDTSTKAVFTEVINSFEWNNGPAWIGFTAGTGAATSTVKILTWSYSGGPGCGQ